MDILAYLLPGALFLGLLALVAFSWALRAGQFDDLEGAAHRILLDDGHPQPPTDSRKAHQPSMLERKI